ncbi:MAG: MFS transporter [Faecousia sp.]
MLADRFGTRAFILYTSALAWIATWLLIFLPTNPGAMYLAAGMMGLAYPLCTVTPSLLMSDTFGQRACTGLLGLVQASTFVSIGIFFPAAGFLYRAQGSYRWAFTLINLLMVVMVAAAMAATSEKAMFLRFLSSRKIRGIATPVCALARNDSVNSKNNNLRVSRQSEKRGNIMEKERTLSKRSILAYGFGEFSRQGSGIVQSTFLLFYLVNYAGLKATYVGIMMMLAKIWDAINDPIMGTIVDNTNSKHGKVRPYLLYCSIPSGLFLLMLFAVPSGLSDVAKMIWVTVAYVGTGMLMTMVDVPYNTLMVRVTDSSQERMRMARSKGLIGTLGVLLPSMVIPMITGKASNVGTAYSIGVGILRRCSRPAT